MELRQFLAVLQRWWWLIALVALLAAGVSYLVSRQLPLVYEARATLLVNVSSTPGASTYGDVILSQQLVKTYSNMAAQPVVLEKVNERLNLSLGIEQLGQMVTVQPVRDTQLFTVTVQGQTPTLVRDVANAVAAVFIEQQNQRLAQSLAANAISVAQPALLPARPVGPQRLVNTVLAAVAGLLLALGLVFLLEYLDDTVKTPEDLEQAVALPHLGTVMRFSARDGVQAPGLLIDLQHGQTPAAEAYRLLRTNLDFSAVQRPLRTLLVTSSSPGEGKSTTVANLALVLAQVGKRVIVVDTDLRKPALHRLFQMENRQGLTNLLLDQMGGEPPVPPEGFLHPGPVEHLRVLTSGPLPPNPAELLQSPQFAAVLKRLQQEADVILLDSPPALTVADALLLAQRVDATLLVVDTGRTRSDALRRAVAALQPSGTHLVGVVLNKLSRRQASYYYQHYYYYYGENRSRRDGAVSVSAEPQAQREGRRTETG